MRKYYRIVFGFSKFLTHVGGGAKLGTINEAVSRKCPKGDATSNIMLEDVNRGRIRRIAFRRVC
jgi:hypothetical protein